jgi:integrase
MMFAGRATCPTCLTPANRRKRCGIRSLQDRVQITIGTALAEAGVDLAVIQALMGHEHVDAVAAYVHLAPTHVRAEFDAARARQPTR